MKSGQVHLEASLGFTVSPVAGVPHDMTGR